MTKTVIPHTNIVEAFLGIMYEFAGVSERGFKKVSRQIENSCKDMKEASKFVSIMPECAIGLSALTDGINRGSLLEGLAGAYILGSSMGRAYQNFISHPKRYVPSIQGRVLETITAPIFR